jgi:hypothetical protein
MRSGRLPRYNRLNRRAAIANSVLVAIDHKIQKFESHISGSELGLQGGYASLQSILKLQKRCDGHVEAWILGTINLK